MRAALAALLLGATTASAAPHVLRAQGWTADGPTLAHDLTHAPHECLGSLTPSAEAGRALFRSPGLLGGPAARLGLSCNACHSNGRVNTRFYLQELTNRPGAVDVTSEWASRVRGDGIMNPRDIPDLAGVNERATHGRLNDPSLEHFVRGVIEEEFQGEPPSAQTFADLMAYLRALDARVCQPGEIAITLASAANDVRRAMRAAEGADASTASAVLYAAQDGMGRIVERLPAARFSRERRALESLSRELGAMRASNVIAALAAGAEGWNARFDAAIAQIAPREQRTYFNEATLRGALSH